MFYVSTFGGSGSAWFARVLSRHPDLVCFHGTLSMPPAESGRFPDLAPTEFAEALHLCYGACRHVTMFGAIHGFPGLQMKDAIEQKNGVFAALLRHPIMRINSLFSSYARQHSNFPKDCTDVYKPFSNELWQYAEFNFSEATIGLHNFSQEFLMLAFKTIEEDMIAIRNLEPSHVFRFEELTTERQYYADCFRTLVNGFASSIDYSIRPEPTESYLDIVFAEGVYNKKADGVEQPDAVFAKWPDFFKFLFAMAIKGQGGKLVVTQYKEFGYDLPDVLSHINYAKVSPAIWRAVSENLDLSS